MFLGAMKTVIFINLLLIISTDTQSPEQCATSPTNRAPEDTDITVTCGKEFMDLSILLCPIYKADYNESLMILNNQTSEECRGTADFSVDPPVLRYRFSITEQSLAACNNDYLITHEAGHGEFSDFSDIQHVIVTGLVVTVDPAAGMITYRPQVTYIFSCKYPLQYVLDNTAMTVGGVDLAINENNGSFISTLLLSLYSNELYNEPLLIPQTGLPLKTRIFVEVSAANLANRFNVLLLWCTATVDPRADVETQGYDLFIGCDVESHTTVEENGVSDKARFIFEAFRFLEHQKLAVSTFYLHCYVRLCHKEQCPSLLPNCTGTETGRRRRDATAKSNAGTVTSQAIIVSKQTSDVITTSTPHAAPTRGAYSSPVVAVIVSLAVLALLLVAMGAYFTWTLKHKVPL